MPSGEFRHCRARNTVSTPTTLCLLANSATAAPPTLCVWAKAFCRASNSLQSIGPGGLGPLWALAQPRPPRGNTKGFVGPSISQAQTTLSEFHDSCAHLCARFSALDFRIVLFLVLILVLGLLLCIFGLCSSLCSVFCFWIFGLGFCLCTLVCSMIFR